jgi:hypothetical protein
VDAQQAEFRVVPGIALIEHDKNIQTENGFNTNYGIYQDFKVSFAKMWQFSNFSGSHDVKDSNDYTLAFDTRLTALSTSGSACSSSITTTTRACFRTEPNYSKIVTGLQITF